MTRLSAKRRTGVAMIAVLALMALAGAMFVTWTRIAVQSTQQSRQAHENAQADWLATAALSRAAARLRLDDSYQGESWRLASEQIDQAYDAQVEITVDSQPIGTRVTAVAQIPSGDNPRVQRTQTITLSLPNPRDEP